MAATLLECLAEEALQAQVVQLHPSPLGEIAVGGSRH